MQSESESPMRMMIALLVVLGTACTQDAGEPTEEPNPAVVTLGQPDATHPAVFTRISDVHEVWADCDADCLIYLVDPEGPSCHTGRDACFFRQVAADGTLQEPPAPPAPERFAAPSLVRLWSELEARRASSGDKSYTRSLLDRGAAKIGEKLREEADELAVACAQESEARVVSEAADLTYHTLVALLLRGCTLRELASELARRFGVSGHQEKASRK